MLALQCTTKPLENNTATSLPGNDVVADVIKNAVYKDGHLLTKAF